MGTVQRKKKKFQARGCALVSCIFIGAVTSFLLAQNEFETMGKPMAPEKTQSKQSRFSGRKEMTTIDVNAPPVRAEATRKDETAGATNFVFGWNPVANPIITSNEETTKRNRNKSSRPIPVVVDEEDRVPHAASGAAIRASDALLCHSSVVDFVINATDLKDECDGLKKAFGKYCEGEDESEKFSSHRSLREDLDQEHTPNPIAWWRNILNNPSPFSAWVHGVFPSPDSLAQALSERSKRSHDSSSDSSHDQARANYVQSRGLEDARAFSQAERIIDTEEVIFPRIDSEIDESRRQDKSTKTNLAVPREKLKTSNLSLPTKKHHVSDKMLSEALLLKREEKIMSEVKAAHNTSIHNGTADNMAAASTKAVTDTIDVVSSVLNDPSSVEARTCCASILNVFHESCYVDEEEELSDLRLVIVVTVIALCGWVKSLIRYFQIRWLPEAAGCIVVGVISGWVLSVYPHHDVSFDGPWFLRIMVPPIVFEAALSIDKRSFNRHVVPILLYAVLGTLFSTSVTAYILHQGSKFYHGYCETIPVIEALIFGSLISSIDPIAVLSVLSNMGMTDTDTIFVLIFGESLLNDGVAIVLFQTLVHFLDANMEVDTNAILAAIIHFLVVAIGSLLVGLASGICCTIYYWTMHGCQTPLIEVLMFCCWALIPYYVCDGIEWSGIVAVVAAGFVMDIYVVGPHGSHHEYTPGNESIAPTLSRPVATRKPRAIFSHEGQLSLEAKTHIGFVTEIIATMMETAIFAYLGLFLFSSRYHWNIYHTFIAIGACCASRAFMIPFLSSFANWITTMQQTTSICLQKVTISSDHDRSPQKELKFGVCIDGKMQLILWFAGLRGAMSFALVENIPLFDTVSGEGTRLKSELKAMTSACILFTVFVLGGSTFYIMEYLGIAPSASKSPNGYSGLQYSHLPQNQSVEHLDEDETIDEFHHEEIPMMGIGTGKPPHANGFRQRTQNHDPVL